MTKYCYSIVNAETLEQAVEEAKEQTLGLDELWIGEAITPGPPSLVDVEDTIACQMYDEVGEPADQWPDLSKEESEKLRTELDKVLMRHLEDAGEWPPPFWKAENCRKIRDKTKV